MNFAKTIKMTALAGLSAIAIAGGFASPASAHTSYVRCDRDGDRCVRVVCDNDGDDCRRVGYGRDYDRDYNRGYYGREYRRAYYNGGHRQLICDRWGRGCHYVWVDGNGYYRQPDGVYLRFNVR